jgi:hypothetical protein
LLLADVWTRILSPLDDRLAGRAELIPVAAETQSRFSAFFAFQSHAQAETRVRAIAYDTGFL